MRPPLLLAAVTMMACAPEIVTPLLVSDGEITPPRDRGPRPDESIPRADAAPPPPDAGGDAGLDADPDATRDAEPPPDAAARDAAPPPADAGDTGPDAADADRDAIGSA